MIDKKMLRLGTKRSCIRELFEYGNKLKATIGADKVFDYSLGNPSTPPPKEVDEAIAKIISEDSSLIHSYTSAQGKLSCRQAICSNLNSRYNAELTPDKIYITCGAAASLCISLKAITDSETNEVIVPAPYFPEYRVFVEAAGGKFISTPPTEELTLDLKAISRRITKKTAAIIINSPNNPSGVIYSRKQLEGLSALLTEKSKKYRHPIYIISDEPYREISYGDEVTWIPSVYKNTVVCYSFSKSLSLPGERIGYIAIPPRADKSASLYAAICGAGRALGYVCAPALMQEMLVTCCGMTSDFGVYKENRAILYSALTALGYSCVMPQGAFYLFVKSPYGTAEQFSEVAKKLGLLIVPAGDFGCPDYLRLSYCVDTDMIRRSLPLFATALNIAEKELKS